MDPALGKNRKIFSPEQLLYPPPYHLMGKFGFTYNGKGLCCSTLVGHTISPFETHTLCTVETEIGSKQKGCGKFPILLHLFNARSF